MTDDVELTGRQKLVYEAVQKIQMGERMRQEGLMELNHLIPETDKTKAVANRTLRSPGLFRKVKNNQTDEQLINRIVDMLNKKQRVTASHVHSTLNISESRVRRLCDKMKKMKLLTVEKSSASKGARAWVKVSNTNKSKTFVEDPETASKVLGFLRTNSWVTTHKVIKDLKLTWYPAKQTLDSLVANNQAKIVTRANNPAHHGTSAYNRKFDYWEPV